MRTDKDIEADERREREFHPSVFGRELSRGETRVVYIPPAPKIRIIFSDGKEKQCARLPDNESNTEWDWKVIAAYINTRLRK